MFRALILFVGVLIALASCTQRTICPAFQSAYIYDKDELRKKFSYFQEDSTPKILTASKNRYLVAEATPYRKKLRSLQTVAMKPVPVQVPDSLLHADSATVADLERAALSVMDTTFAVDVPVAAASGEDSVYVITKDKELRLLKYNAPDSLVYDPVTQRYVPQKASYYVKDVRLNIDQDNYMWYLRDYLILPDVKLARLQQNADGGRDGGVKAGKKKKEKKGFKGFFKDLFKKKPKESDSLQAPPAPRDEFDFIDVDTVAQATPPVQQQEARRGFFAPKSRKSATTDEPLTPRNNREKKQADALKEEEF